MKRRAPKKNMDRRPKKCIRELSLIYIHWNLLSKVEKE